MKPCIVCDSPISSIRLAIVPTATRCVPCQTDYERWHRPDALSTLAVYACGAEGDNVTRAREEGWR